MSKPTLVFFGNNCLQNDRFVTSFDGTRSSTGIDVQSIALARDSGSRVVNTRYEEKMLSLSGQIFAKNKNLQDTMVEFDLATSSTEEQYLRVVNDYQYLVNTATTSNWTTTNVSNFAVNTTDFQTESSSLEFDLGTGTSATLENTATAFDLTGKTGNIEAIIYFKNKRYIGNVQIRVGQSSSNYYRFDYLYNYEGKLIKNGSNLFSAPINSAVTVGTPTLSNITYYAVIINYDTASPITDCYLDSIMYVEEDRVRNFPSYRSGQIEKSGLHYQNEYVSWSGDWRNHTGYAISTHSIGLFSSTGIVTNTDTQIIDLGGSVTPLPLFTLNTTVGSPDTMTITNETNEQSMILSTSTIPAFTNINVGGLDKQINAGGSPLDVSNPIIDFENGINQLKLTIAQASITNTIPTSVVVKNATRTNNTSTDYTYRAISQSFTTASANPIYSIALDLGAVSLGTRPYAVGTLRLVTNNAGTPSTTALWSGNISNIVGTNAIIGLNIPVSNATVYHLVLLVSVRTPLTPSGFDASSLSWDYNTANVYASGGAYISGDITTTLPFIAPNWASASWTSQTGDQVFRIVQSSTPTWSANWGASYRKLYQS
jgi:hypothetical protein